MTRRDPRGNPVSTDSADALDASERALWRMMSFYGAPLDDLDAAVAADPRWLLPRLMRAGFLLSLTEPALVGAAHAALDEAEALASAGNDRERGHLVALRLLAAGDWTGAGGAWQRVLDDHPRDALALQWAHLFDFYRGDAAQLCERVGRALPAWSESDPLLPYVLGQHAFGLEETGRYDEAEDTGRRALAGTARARRGWPSGGRTGAKATALPVTSAGTRPSSRSSGSTTSERSRSSTAICAPTRTRSRCSASTPPRCCGASRSRARTSARAGRSCSPRGRSTAPTRAFPHSTTSTHCSR